MTMQIASVLKPLMRRPILLGVSILITACAIGVGFALNSIHRQLDSTTIPGAAAANSVVTLTLIDRNRSLRNLTIEFIHFVNSSSSTLTGAASHTAIRSWAELPSGARRLNIDLVHGPYFDILGVDPAAGRYFESGDYSPRSMRTIVISDAMWETEFGRSQKAIGSSIAINDVPFQVIGVTNRNFVGLSPHNPTDAWIPHNSYLTTRVPVSDSVLRRTELPAIGVLNAGVSPAAAGSELVELRRRFDGAFRLTEEEASVDVIPGVVTDIRQAEDLRRVSSLWLGVSVLLLLVAFLNVAGLQATRLLERRSEFFIRYSVGATTMSMTRQLCIESFVIMFSGTIVGVVIGYWARKALVTLDVFARLPPISTFSMTEWDFGYLIVIVVAGCMTLIMSSISTLRVIGFDTSHPTTTYSSGKLLALFVSGQLAAAMIVVSVSLMGFSQLTAMLNAKTGMEMDGVYFVTPEFQTGHREGVVFSRELYNLYSYGLEEVLDANSGVSDFAHTDTLPFERSPSVVQLSSDASPDTSVSSIVLDVEPGYFDVLGIPVLAGSVGDWKSMGGVIVSNALALRLWGGTQDALNKTIFRYELNGGDKAVVRYTVRGVVADTAYSSPANANEAILYRLFEGTPFPIILFRTSSEPSAVLKQIDMVTKEFYPGLEIRRVSSLQSRFDAQIKPIATKATITFVGTIFIVFLTGVGMFAVVRNSVNSRLREIAIRMTLGASPVESSRFLGNSVAGMLVAAAVFTTATSAYWLPKASDLIVGEWSPAAYIWFAFSIGATALVAAIASLGSIRKAMTVQPAEILRTE